MSSVSAERLKEESFQEALLGSEVLLFLRGNGTECLVG